MSGQQKKKFWEVCRQCPKPRWISGKSPQNAKANLAQHIHAHHGMVSLVKNRVDVEKEHESDLEWLESLKN